MVNARTAVLVSTCLLAAPAFSQWVPAQAVNLTTPLAGAAMAARSAGDVYLFGGDNNGALSGATWWWAGSEWYAVNTGATAPSARREAILVHDSNRGRFVLHGGWTTTGTTGPADDQTWEFTGTQWSLVGTAASPGGRWKHGACFDTVRNRTVLFGGASSGQTLAGNTTWEFDGSNWTQVVTTTAPSPRENHAMCWHGGLGRCVVFGGFDPSTGTNNETWLYSGSNWVQLAVPQAPPARRSASLVYDGSRGVAILFGGIDAAGVTLADTWEFDGVTWTLQPTTAPAGADVALAFDSARRRAVRHGGAGSPGQTWLYGAYTDGIGLGCVGSNGQVLLTGDAARIGQPILRRVLNLASTQLGVVILSLTQVPAFPLDVIGMTGCFGHVTPDVLFAVVGNNGTAIWNGMMPNNLTLLGIALYSQGLSLDPGWNPASLVASNALYALVGH